MMTAMLARLFTIKISANSRGDRCTNSPTRESRGDSPASIFSISREESEQNAISDADINADTPKKKRDKTRYKALLHVTGAISIEAQKLDKKLSGSKQIYFS